MDKFDRIRHEIDRRYISFRPSFCFIHSESGLQMLVKLVKNDIEVLISVNEKYPEIKTKLDSLIIISKNKKSNHYCQCGYNLSRYADFTKCRICKTETCSCCFYTSFKINQGLIVCYNCGNTTEKKIKPQSAFDRIFNNVLKMYVEETDDTSLLELLIVE